VEAPKGMPNGGSPHANSAAPHRAAPVQPSAIPSSLPLAPAESEPSSAMESAEPASEDSLGIGPGTSPGPVGVPDGGAGEDIRPANAPDVTPPVAILTTQPKYPSPAIHVRMQGVVILEAIIGTDGEVRGARVLRSAGALLDEAAEKAILEWRYRPARVAGKPVAVYLTVTVKFGIS
jgi:protein TonB